MSPQTDPEREPAVPGDTAMAFGASLRIQDVAAGHRWLEQSLRGSAPIRIDLSQLIDIDSAGVQLLVAYCREAARLGIDVHFFGAAQALHDALKLLGLSGALTGHAGR